jgi:hypothetical protein
VNGHVWVEHLLLNLPGGQLGFLIVVNLLVFVLAFFLDFFELSFIVVPLLGPVAEKLGIDLIWFGVLLGVNMQTSFMHPPFGFALFYLRSVAPAATTSTRSPASARARHDGQIYWGAIPFVVIQLDHGGLLIAFPQMSLVYKSGARVDPSKVKIEIPPTSRRTPDDILKDLQKGGRRGRPGRREPARAAEDKAAEDIEKALRAGNEKARRRGPFSDSDLAPPI